MTAPPVAPRGAGFAHRLPFGAHALGRGRAQFRLWAPAQREVQLEVEGAAPRAMARDEQGWFEAEAACAPGARYRYRLGSGERVPDPASRFQPADVHGPSELIDPLAYAWRHPHWRGRPWRESVIYELHAGLCGGFAGVAEKLAQFEALGVTAIELMPIADFAGRRNWGYDGVLPYAPDAAYGTPDDLKSLIDRAHGRGLCVFLDVVYNHFGPEGNFLALYAPQFFRDDLRTPWGPAIDFRRAEVRQFFIENALYWLLEYRFDGLRLDAVHAIRDENFLDELAASVRARIEPGRQVHLMLENERNEARLLSPEKFDAQWNDDFHNALHVLLTGEHEGYYAHYVEQPARKLARCLAEGFCHQGEGGRGTPSGHLAPTAFIAFLQNHDQVGNRALGERLIELVDERALRAAVTLLLLSPQIPLLFMGEDFGCRAPFLYFTDFHDALADAVREGRRREFAKFSAFADPGQRSRIPDPNDEDTFRRSVPDFPKMSPSPLSANSSTMFPSPLSANSSTFPSPLSANSSTMFPSPLRGEGQGGGETLSTVWSRFYRELLQLRREHLILRLDGTRALGAQAIGEKAIVAHWQFGDDARLRIGANFGAAQATLEPLRAPLLFESERGAGAAASDGVLLPFSACVFLELHP